MLSLFNAFTDYPSPMDRSLVTSYPSSLVRVVSDSQYKELVRQEAEREALVLENRINRYRTALESLETELVRVRTEAGLLPPAEDTPAS